MGESVLLWSCFVANGALPTKRSKTDGVKHVLPRKNDYYTAVVIRGVPRVVTKVAWKKSLARRYAACGVWSAGYAAPLDQPLRLSLTQYVSRRHRTGSMAGFGLLDSDACLVACKDALGQPNAEGAHPIIVGDHIIVSDTTHVIYDPEGPRLMVQLWSVP